MKVSSAFLLAATALTGLIGGIGFVNFMGFMPAMRDTPAEDIVLYWQIVDSYMSVRMPIFGFTILLSFIGCGFFLIKQTYKQPLWLMVLALGFVLADIAIASVYNFPFNRLIQNITPQTIPDNFEYYCKRSAYGFNLRSVCMIGTFISTLAALFSQASKGLLK